LLAVLELSIAKWGKKQLEKSLQEESVTVKHLQSQVSYY
jgi:hypothetical protein